MKHSNKHILIAGGGICGLTAAISLRKAGFSCSVFERASTNSEVGAGISLWENALKVYRNLGLYEELVHRGNLLDFGGIGLSDGRILSQMDKNGLKEMVGDFEMLGIHRCALQQTLVEALPENVIQYGHQVCGIDQDEQGVILHFENGEQTRGDVLIGADGIHSAVRRIGFGEFSTRYAGYTCWRGIGKKFSGWKGGSGEFWGPDCRFGLIPIDDEHLYWFAVKTAEQGTPDAMEGRKERLHKRYEGWKHQIPEVIENTPEEKIIHNDIIDVEPKKGWSQGRIVLMGDAIHATTPNMGQGACMAIESAQIFANLLQKEADLSEILTEFESIRFKRTTGITKDSWQLGKMAQIQNPIARWLRNHMIRLVPASIQIRQMVSLVEYDAAKEFGKNMT